MQRLVTDASQCVRGRPCNLWWLRLCFKVSFCGDSRSTCSILKSAMHANRKFTVQQDMLGLPREGELVALGKWVDSHVEADGVSTDLAVSRLIRVLILREADRAPDTNIAADICLAAKMAQESEVRTLRNVNEVVLNRCELACGPRTDAKSSVEPAPMASRSGPY